MRLEANRYGEPLPPLSSNLTKPRLPTTNWRKIPGSYFQTRNFL